MAWIKRSMDSGRIDLADRIQPGWSADLVEVQRRGDLTVLSVLGLYRAPDAAQTFLTLPAGFLPTKCSIGLVTGASTPVVVQAYTNLSLQLLVPGYPAGTTGSTYATAVTTVAVPGLARPTGGSS